jgi:transposase InsO family protein
MTKFSAKQQIRFDLIQLYISGDLTGFEVAQTLEISERHVRRLAREFKQRGIESLFHGNIGRSPVNKISDTLRKRIADLYRLKYKGFNLAHFREKLMDVEGLNPLPSYSTIRDILFSNKILAPQTRRRKKTHARRKRYEREGIMVQIDGSHHRWFSGCLPVCLTAAVDDATGKIVGASFTKTETTFAAMDVVEQILENHGKFQMLYSDRAGVYTNHKRDGFSNLKTALHELGIVSVQASSPQAKGRVERLFRSLQSRLVSELRLANIRTIEEGHRFLKKFIEEYNRKFAVPAKSPDSAYEKLPFGYPIDQHMCFRHTRVVGNGEAISLNGSRFVIRHEGFDTLYRQTIEAREYRNGRLRFFYHGEELESEYIEGILKSKAS